MTAGSGSKVVRTGLISALGIFTLIVWGFVWLLHVLAQDPVPALTDIGEDYTVDYRILSDGPEPPVPTGPVRVNMDNVETPPVVDRATMDVCERAAWDLYPGPAQQGSRSKLIEGCRTSQSRAR